jgi:DNA transformation protein
MPSDRAFTDGVLRRLTPFGPVAARAMFGGFGLYLDGVMFGLIAFDRLYFKVDEANRADYQRAGTGPLTYPGRTKPTTMSYFEVPSAVFSDAAVLAAWAEQALSAARRGRPAAGRRRRPAGTQRKTVNHFAR